MTSSETIEDKTIDHLMWLTGGHCRASPLHFRPTCTPDLRTGCSLASSLPHPSSSHLNFSLSIIIPSSHLGAQLAGITISVYPSKLRNCRHHVGRESTAHTALWCGSCSAGSRCLPSTMLDQEDGLATSRSHRCSWNTLQRCS